jgi:hypothetical protein
MSFLSAIVKIPGAIFHWLASDKGQAVVGAVETVAIGFGAPAVVIGLINSWLNKILTIEQIAEGAGAQSGTGAQKAAAVIAAITPELLKDFPGLPAENITNINNALVIVLNNLTVPATPAPVAGA